MTAKHTSLNCRRWSEQQACSRRGSGIWAVSTDATHSSGRSSDVALRCCMASTGGVSRRWKVRVPASATGKRQSGRAVASRCRAIVHPSGNRARAPAYDVYQTTPETKSVRRLPESSTQTGQRSSRPRCPVDGKALALRTPAKSGGFASGSRPVEVRERHKRQAEYVVEIRVVAFKEVQRLQPSDSLTSGSVRLADRDS